MTHEEAKQPTDNTAEPELAVGDSSAAFNETAVSHLSSGNLSQQQGTHDLPSERHPPVHVQSEDCIEMRRLHRFFGETKAVDDVSFSVKSGDMFSVISAPTAQAKQRRCVFWPPWICRAMVTRL